MKSRRVLLSYRRAERAGKNAGGFGKAEVRVGGGKPPPIAAPKRQIRAGDVLIERGGCGTDRGRRRQEGGAVDNRLLPQIPLEDPGPDFRNGRRLVGGDAAADGGEKARHDKKRKSVEGASHR